MKRGEEMWEAFSEKYERHYSFQIPSAFAIRPYSQVHYYTPDEWRLIYEEEDSFYPKIVAVWMLYSYNIYHNNWTIDEWDSLYKLSKSLVGITGKTVCSYVGYIRNTLNINQFQRDDFESFIFEKTEEQYPGQQIALFALKGLDYHWKKGIEKNISPETLARKRQQICAKVLKYEEKKEVFFPDHFREYIEDIRVLSGEEAPEDSTE